LINGYIDKDEEENGFSGRVFADNGDVQEDVDKILLVNKEYPVFYQGVTVMDKQNEMWKSFDQYYEPCNENLNAYQNMSKFLSDRMDIWNYLLPKKLDSKPL
jgi:hypothetical protein